MATTDAQLPEPPEEFTSLDKLLTKTIEASSLGIAGAPNSAEIDALTNEIVHLNADRKRSFFHRGFFESISGSRITFGHSGESRESRLWHLAGVVLGLARRDDATGCAKLLGDSPTLLAELCNDTNPFRVRLLLPIVYPILWNGGLRSGAASCLENGIPLLDLQDREKIAREILENASELIRNNDSGDALLLLETLPEPLSTQLLESAFSRRLVRKKAQCLQSLGQGHAAECRLKELSDLGDFEESIEALADLGLLAGGFSSLYAILPGRTIEEHRSLSEALNLGLGFFDKAVERDQSEDGTSSRNAHFALGVKYVVHQLPDPTRASKHLSAALTGMLKDPRSYERGNLLLWARFLLGLSILEICDETRLRAAAGFVRSSLQNEVQFPLSLWKRCLNAATLSDDKSVAREICEELLQRRGQEVFELIRESGVLERSRELRTRYAEWITKSTRAFPILADDWEMILRFALADSQIDLASVALDQLEELAHTWDNYGARFLALLGNAANYSPAWEPSEAEEAIVRLLESQGKLGEASVFLQRQFWKLRAEHSRDSRAEAETILERLREWHRPEEEIEPLHLPEKIDATPEEESEYEVNEQALRTGPPIRILFVGGDERQARHDETVSDGLAEKYPSILVEFEHPGWGSNWKPVSDRIEAHLRDFEALVLSNLLRTNMGRTLRKMCDGETPWFACSGKGPGMITDSIVKAAMQIVSRRRIPKI